MLHLGQLLDRSEQRLHRLKLRRQHNDARGRGEGAASVLLDVRRPDYLGPAFDLCLDLGGEFPGRARDDFEAE
jgi:hypothetical protein